MRSIRGICSAAVCFAFFSSFSLLFSHSYRESQRQKIPQHDAAAIVKLVTVRVLDQEGRPVTDLQKEDFILYDNGKKKVITEFEVHILTGEGMKVGPSEEEAEPARQVEGMNRRIFIFLDIQGSDVTGMANAKKAALHFIETMLQPGDELGILGYSPTRGFLIQDYLTTDHKRIRKALEKLKDIEVMPAPGSVSGGELDDSVRDRSGGTGSSRSTGSSGSAESASGGGIFGYGGIALGVPGSSQRHRKDFIPRMSDLTEALKYIPGNKSLIIFTARNMGPYSAQLGKDFASASTPVYTVNTQNWIREGVMTLSVKKKHTFEDHPLKDLALASGGKYFADIKDVETISKEVQSLTANFYVLGYYIDETWDGKYHQIEVEVDKPKLQVLAQHGYFNPLPFSELTDFQKQLHLFDLVFTDKYATSGLLGIPIVPLYVAGEEETNCIMLFQITIDEKTGVPPDNAEIYSLLFDEEQKMVKEINGEIDFSPFDNEILVPYFLANLDPGKYDCRVVARDKETGQASVGKTTFEIPDTSSSDSALTSPLLFASGKESKVFKFSKEKSQKEKNKDLSLGNVYKYLPKNHRIVVQEIGPETKSFFAVLPVISTGHSASEVEFAVRLRPKPEGESIVLPMQIKDVRPVSKNKNILMMEIGLPELAPGEYELEIEATAKNPSSRFSVRRSLTKR
jgi:VWFA-related protein